MEKRKRNNKRKESSALARAKRGSAFAEARREGNLVPSRNNKKGVTLIELIVAIFVLTVGLLALYSVLIYGLRVNTKTKYKTLAFHIAQQEMEILRNTKFDEITTPYEGSFIGTTEEIQKFQDQLSKLPSGQGILNTSYEVEGKVKKIVVKVLWKEGGDQKDVNLTTLITKGGLNP